MYGTAWNCMELVSVLQAGRSDVTHDPLRSLNIIKPLNTVFQPPWLLLACAVIHY